MQSATLKKEAKKAIDELSEENFKGMSIVKSDPIITSLPLKSIVAFSIESLLNKNGEQQNHSRFVAHYTHAPPPPPRFVAMFYLFFTIPAS